MKYLKKIIINLLFVFLWTPQITFTMQDDNKGFYLQIKNDSLENVSYFIKYTMNQSMFLPNKNITITNGSILLVKSFNSYIHKLVQDVLNLGDIRATKESLKFLDSILIEDTGKKLFIPLQELDKKKDITLYQKQGAVIPKNNNEKFSSINTFCINPCIGLSFSNINNVGMLHVDSEQSFGSVIKYIKKYSKKDDIPTITIIARSHSLAVYVENHSNRYKGVTSQRTRVLYLANLIKRAIHCNLSIIFTSGKEMGSDSYYTSMGINSDGTIYFLKKEPQLSMRYIYLIWNAQMLWLKKNSYNLYNEIDDINLQTIANDGIENLVPYKHWNEIAQNHLLSKL